MKIIKLGKIEDKEKKETCYKCKTKFSYSRSDTQEDREGKYVKCPLCDAFIAVD